MTQRNTLEKMGLINRLPSARFSPDGGRILTSSMDKTLKLWDLNGNLAAKYDTHEGEVYYATFSPNGKWIISVSANGRTIIWQTPRAIIQRLKSSPISQVQLDEGLVKLVKKERRK